MISDLLDFTRARLGKGIPIERQPANLRHICLRVVEEFEIAHPGRKVTLSGAVDCSGEWDPERLAQALGNLVGNALAYSQVDSPVEITVAGSPRAAVLEVKNYGSPIPAELLPRLFDPFLRGKNTTSNVRSGLGLGLFIVQQIVEGHGGKIDVRSNEKETVFTVMLPRVAPTLEPAPGVHLTT